MEDSNRLAVPFWMNLESALTALPINTSNASNFHSGLLTIDCLICGNQLTCSQITVYNKEEEKWAHHFCDVFSMNFPDAHYIVRSSYYCGGCNETVRKIASTCSQIEKLKSDLQLMKGACENQIRWAKSNVTFANVHNQCYSREKIFHYLNGSRQRSSHHHSASGSNSNSQQSVPVANFCNKHEAQESSAIIPEEVSQQSTKDPSSAAVAPEAEDNSPSTDHFEDASTHYSDDEEFTNSDPQITTKDRKTNNVDTLNEDKLIRNQHQPVDATNTSTVPYQNPQDDDEDKIRTRDSNRSKIPMNVQKGGTDDVNLKKESRKRRGRPSKMIKVEDAVYNSSEFEKETDSDSPDEINTKDPDFDVSDVLYLSMPKEKSGVKKRASKRRASRAIPTTDSSRASSFHPTIFSDRDKDENLALRRRFKSTMDKYDVKDCIVPVGRIPDLNDQEDESDGRRRQCPIVDCTSVFYKNFKLIEHIKVAHQGIPYPYECTICHKRYMGRLEFRDHGNTHTGLKPYDCPQCDMKFALKSKLNEHIRNIHEEKKFMCDQCGKCFSSKNNCELHLKTHTGERPFTCEICGKSFRQKYDLRNHQTRHPELNLVPFRCEFCQKVFANIHSLKVHVLAHTGDSPFTCEVCGYKAAFEATMKVHKLKHKLGHEYECDICGKKLKNELILANHKKFWCKERNEATCKTCGKVFKNPIVLKQHEKVHNRTDKTFLCSECGMSFFWSKNLRRHSKTCHKKTVLPPEGFLVNAPPLPPLPALPHLPGVPPLPTVPPNNILPIPSMPGISGL